MRAALINGNGLVVNVAVFADNFAGTTWNGLALVPSEAASIGDSWDGTKFSRPAPPLAPTTLSSDLAAIASPAGGVVVDAEARATLAALVAALQKDATTP